MSGGGRLQHVEKGTPLTVSVAIAKKLGAKLVDPSQAEKLVDGKMVESTDNATAEQLASAREGLEAQATQLAAAQSEIAALKESDNVQATQQFAQKLAAEQEKTKKLKAEVDKLKKAAKV